MKAYRQPQIYGFLTASIMRPPFRGARMTVGVTVLAPQIEVYLGAGRAGRLPRLVNAERLPITVGKRRGFRHFAP